AGRALGGDALGRAPVEVVAPAGRLVPRPAGVHDAPALEPAVLVGGPRLHALVDDEELVEVGRPLVIARERRVGPHVEVEPARDDERVADAEVADADVVDELEERDGLLAAPDVPVAEVLVEPVPRPD